ncbi:ArsO family NAD(P)H-dependent flavin-containing monooxygenase [Salinifilum ghardaiensis]
MTDEQQPRAGAPRTRDAVVIGGGQAGLAAGYFLRRAGLDFAVLDARSAPGGAWRDMWDSLHLFSPAEHSPLPGWWMPRQDGREYPDAAHVVRYLERYEQRYELPVHRPVRAASVRDAGGPLRVDTDRGAWHARFVLSATGTWDRPRVPACPGRELFTGRELHTADYRSPEEFRGLRVAVVGGGNSAAQILAELSEVAEALWLTRRPPRFMPDDVDGRVLFDVATRRQRARGAGQSDPPAVGDLGDIVMVPSVRAARDRGALRAHGMFDRLTRDGLAWDDGTEWPADAVLWCTGFSPNLDHLEPLGLTWQDGVVKTEGTRSVDDPRLHLLGYGDWTGPASATLIGAGRHARGAVDEITEQLRVSGR